MNLPDATPILLPLLPLHAVLFPQGKLSLKIVEPRYIKLINACIKTQAPFGVVTVKESATSAHLQEPMFSHTGTLANVTTTDLVTHMNVQSISTLSIECVGTQRFQHQHIMGGGHGFWIAQDALLLSPDLPAVIPEALQHCSDLLQRLVTTLIMQGKPSFEQPFQFGNASWVANRWAELLPLSVSERLTLLETINPHDRLEAVAQHIAQADMMPL